MVKCKHMQKVLVVYNILAGNGRFTRKLKTIERYLKAHDYDYDFYAIKRGENAVLTIKHVAPHYNVLIILGGDGTIHSVVNGVMSLAKETRPRLLFLPFGTSNDYARMLGMKKNINKSLTLLSTNNHRFVDVNQVNDKFFIYAAALGKFSNVSYGFKRRTQKLFGKFGYLLNALNDLFKHYDFSVNINGVNYDQIFLILIVNGTRVGGFNISGFTSKTSLYDNRLHLKLFKRKSFMSWFKVIIFYFFRGLSFKSDIRISASKFIIEPQTNKAWNFDGEKSEAGLLNVLVLPKELDVYLKTK